MAPRAETLRVKGYREFLAASDRAGKESKREVRGTFRKVGDIVRSDAERRFMQFDAHSAAGYRTRVRVRGVSVEQSLRKTTGNRPDYGALQMTAALLPALERQEDAVVEAFEAALDQVADHFEGH
jgi:hypothetical protein